MDQNNSNVAPSEPSCANCRYSRKEGIFLQCRHELPVIRIEGGDGWWPNIRAEDWCRFWRPQTCSERQIGRPVVWTEERIMRAIVLAGGKDNTSPVTRWQVWAAANDMQPVSKNTIAGRLEQLAKAGVIGKNDEKKYHLWLEQTKPTPEEIDG